MYKFDNCSKKFDRILDPPECIGENYCCQILPRLCQILSNSNNFFHRLLQNSPTSVKCQLRQFELQIPNRRLRVEGFIQSGAGLGFKRSVTNGIWHSPDTEKIWQRNVKIWQVTEKIWQNLTKFWTVQIVCGKTAVRKIRCDLVKFCQILSNFYKLGAEIFQILSNGSYGNLSSKPR